MNHETRRDRLGRIRHQRAHSEKSALLWKEYQWGIDYRLNDMIDHLEDKRTAFEYDDRGYLIRAIYDRKEEQFRTADKLGNLYETKNKTDRKYTNSQLQQDRTYYYHYDVEGNLIFKEHIKDVGYRPVFSGGELRDRGIQPKSTGKGFLYTWNANGSLRSVTDLKGVTYRFRYDAFGRRLEKRRMASTFRFVWDGNVLLHETFKKDNSENTELTTWVFEGFVPTAKLVNGKAYSIISDHLGTPILAIDSEGNEVWNRQLDIYGRVKREIKASSLGEDVRPFIPFLYQGQYYDFETNLAYNRFRYYNPETGAYISQDPIRLAGGNPTLYGYVKDSNWWVDRFGLDCATIHHYEGDQNNRFGHYSIEVDNGEEIFHTHQVITSTDLSKTTIITVSDDMIPSKSVSIDIPNAISAIDYQKSLIGKDLGAYDVKTNSCVDHISEVLREGGVDIPKSPLGQMKYLKELGF